jgi:hypothetical protein
MPCAKYTPLARARATSCGIDATQRIIADGLTRIWGQLKCIVEPASETSLRTTVKFHRTGNWAKNVISSAMSGNVARTILWSRRLPPLAQQVEQKQWI